MIAPSHITFDVRAGRELALMGVVTVGAVWSDDIARGVFWWQLVLPDAPQRAARASSIDEAKQRLVDAAGDWIAAAGLRLPANDNTEARHER